MQRKPPKDHVERPSRRDPIAECPFCGLPIGTSPHGSDATCVRALRDEVDRLRRLANADSPALLDPSDSTE